MTTIYQTDDQGWYIGPGVADESPLQPDVYLIPAMAYLDAPPAQADWPEGAIPRRTRDGWAMQTPPTSSALTTVEKLAAFLAAHPDVAEMIGMS